MNRIFVYGTLKRGEANERVWPCKPTQVRNGSTFAKLFDLGPYPAMTRADDVDGDWVEGEVWEFTDNQMPAVLERLDRLEGVRKSGCGLYSRQTVDVELGGGHAVLAWAYFMDEKRVKDWGEGVTRKAGYGSVRWTGKAVARG
jgi:gamma-glutamylcyclotransferase (GGCT)/AIG2-like uncharacterized protein YtfP